MIIHQQEVSKEASQMWEMMLLRKHERELAGKRLG